MELELTCIRHGSTQWNKERRYLGHTDVGILQESLIELAPVKEALKGRSFRKVFCSDLKRCRETLDWIYTVSAEQVVFDNRLREMDFGEWEGQTYDQLKHLDTYRNWLSDPESSTPPGGESWGHFQGRIADFMNGLTCFTKEESKDNQLLIVAHGGVIRQIATMTVPGSSFWDFSADPGSLLTLKLTFDGGKWTGYVG